MSPEIARAALSFMQRVELRGSEVPVWLEVVANLNATAAGETETPEDEGAE